MARRCFYLLTAALLCALPHPEVAVPQEGIPDPAAPLDGVCRKGAGWFAPDKLCHLAVSACGTVGLYTVASPLGLAPVPAMLGSAVVMGGLGVVREVVRFDDPDDYLTRKQFSGRDMVWNGLGILLGLGMILGWRGTRG